MATVEELKKIEARILKDDFCPICKEHYLNKRNVYAYRKDYTQNYVWVCKKCGLSLKEKGWEVRNVFY